MQNEMMTKKRGIHMNRMKLLQGVVLIVGMLLMTACGVKEESSAENLILQADGLTKLVIDHRNGDIQVTGNADSDRIEVFPLVKTNGVSMDKLVLKLEAQKDTAYLEARFKGQFLALGSGVVDLEIKVPKELDLDIQSHRDGNIRISDLSSNAKIDNINGHIQVSKVSGSLEIDNRDGGIIAGNIGSDVTVRNLNGHIHIEQVDGSAMIDVGDGSLNIGHVAQDVFITQSGNGEIQIGEVAGQVIHQKE